MTIREATAAMPDESDREVTSTILRDAWLRSDAQTFGDVLDSLGRADATELRCRLDADFKGLQAAFAKADQEREREEREEKAAAEAKRLATPITIKSFAID